MASWIWIVIIVVAVVVVALAVWAAMQNRTSRLRERFGSEYETTVRESPSRWKGESELTARQKRVAALEIRPLSAAERETASAAWRQIQARFVDAPVEATREADALVARVMEQRGYPMKDFEQKAADVSVDHANAVEHYRAAHGISLASERDMATTEDLRQALVHYRVLFDELLEPEVSNDREMSG